MAAFGRAGMGRIRRDQPGTLHAIAVEQFDIGRYGGRTDAGEGRMQTLKRVLFLFVVLTLVTDLPIPEGFDTSRLEGVMTPAGL